MSPTSSTHYLNPLEIDPSTVENDTENAEDNNQRVHLDVTKGMTCLICESAKKPV